MTIKYCGSCGKPLEREVNEKGEEFFFCVNSKCQAQRLSLLESRLETVENLLEISPMVKEKVISVPEQVEVPIVPEAELEFVIDELIRELPDLSVEEGKTIFHSLLNQLEGSRGKLESLLEQLSNKEFISHEYLHQWAILMAYSGKSFIAAQRIIEVGGATEIPFITKVITRGNSVLPKDQSEIVPTHFYSRLLNWAKREGLSETTLDILNSKAGIITPPIEPEKKPEEIITIPLVPVAQEISSKPSIDSYTEPSTKKWIDRFRPEEGWEFAIGANWLRWAGIGAILLSCFALIAWSSAQLDLSETEIAILVFVGVLLAGVILHISSFFLLRFKDRSRYFPSIAYSLAFLAIGIYFILMFALRFHDASPIEGNDQIYIILCLLLILIVLITAWGHNSNVLFLEGFCIMVWSIWHISSQIYFNNLLTIDVNLVWISYLIFTLVFLGIAYIRKDMVLISSIQLITLSPLFLPDSSELLSSHVIIEDINDLNATIVLLVFSTLIYFIISFRFPQASPNQFYDLITRDHLSITSVTPVFASFFLLSLESISGTYFLHFILISITAFLILAYDQSDLGLAFLIVLLFQFLWLLSIGMMKEVSIFNLEINSTLSVLSYITIINWIVARKFPSDVEPRFWDSVNRKHLTAAAICPIFLSFILNVFNYVINTIFVIYLILFCILWSSNREITVNIPNTHIRNVSMFDFVTYTSVLLFLITILQELGEDLIGLILGFIAFPFLMMISQNISQISIKQKTIKEFYAIINSVFMAIIFLALVLNNFFTLFSEMIFSVIQIPDFQYGHNWAFLGFLWTVIVLIITTKNFRTFISQNRIKVVLGIIPPLVMYFYLYVVDVSEIITLMFVFVCYIQFLILYYLFEPNVDPESQTGGDEHFFIIPTLIVLQAAVFLLQIRDLIFWNVLIALLANLLLPLSVGFLMIIQKRGNHSVDSYLIISTSIIITLHFLFLDSILQGEAWLLQLAFLGICLFYIYQRILFDKDQIASRNDSHLFLPAFFPKTSFMNKDLFGINILILSIIGFVNTTICFDIFGAALLPVVVLLIFDSLVIFPLVLGSILLGINRRVAIVNVLTLWGIGMLIRLPLMSGVQEFEYNSLLIIGFIIQIAIHIFLLRLSKSELKSSSAIDRWNFEFNSRETWKTDSIKLMALINPLVFYFYASELVTRVVKTFNLTDVMDGLDIMGLLMIVIAVFIGIYCVGVTRIGVPTTISDSGLLFSILITWWFTLNWPELIELIYFSAGATAFLCILYGFWVMSREWRILGLGIIGISIIYSALYLVQLANELVTIVGFGLLGIFSIVIGFVYSKFASRFVINEQKTKG
ncbi:MAG: hypothetical protein ACXAC6_12430 [Candidatus Hodarchaeales archaeon]|jgi:hypothetical protein